MKAGFNLYIPPGATLEDIIINMLEVSKHQKAPCKAVYAGVEFISTPDDTMESMKEKYRVAMELQFDKELAAEAEIYHPTKLEYFTTHALAGLCANPNIKITTGEGYEVLGQAAVIRAVSTIKSLESHVQKTK